MKKILSLTLVIFCIIPLLTLIGCGEKYNENYVYDGESLIGKWVDEEIQANSYDVYEFIDESKVILTTNCRGIELDRLEGAYTVTENNQIVIESEFGMEYIRFSITNDGRLVLLILDDMNRPAEGERIMKKYDLQYNAGKNRLLGTWKSLDDPNEKFVFNEDFTGKSIGLSSKGNPIEYKLYYSYTDKEINIIFEYMIGYEEMVKTSNYKIDGNVLTMYGEDKDGKEITIKFEREN